MPRTITLNEDELQTLNEPFEGQGGFQGLLNELIENVGDNETLILSDEMIERINRYYRQYGTGGFQSRLERIFGNHGILEGQEE